MKNHIQENAPSGATHFCHVTSTYLSDNGLTISEWRGGKWCHSWRNNTIGCERFGSTGRTVWAMVGLLVSLVVLVVMNGQ